MAAVSYRKARVSLPVDVAECPYILDCLPLAARPYLEDYQQRMLQNDIVLGGSVPARPYADHKLRFNRKAYRMFILDVASQHLLEPILASQELTGALLVGKYGGAKQRLVLDARCVNQHFRDAPGVQLFSAEGLSKIKVVLTPRVRPGDSASISALRAFSLHAGLIDVKDCFPRYRAPALFTSYFASSP